MNRQSKQGQISLEEQKNVAQLHRDGVGSAKVQLEMNLEKDTKNNTNKGFDRYVTQKRKVKESIHLLMNTGKLVTPDEKAEVLKKFFASVFTG